MKNNSIKNNTDPCWDREAELAALRAWALRRPVLAVLHGRRRTGKTFLLRRWLRETPGWYVQAVEGVPAAQRAAFAADVSPLVPGFGDAVYPDWRALFSALQARWPAGRPPVLVIDEFPYLAATAPDLPSVLQALVDAPEARRMPLVLCGSSQRMMQGLVLDATAPLYGRAQCIVRLQPLRVTEIAAALGLRDAGAAVEAYATFGGIPRYWELVRELGSDTRHALERLVLSPYGVLHEEAERVLRDEEAAMLERAVCAMIGSGVHRPSELAGRLGIRETTLAKPLRHLVELGVVRRDAPYELHTGKPAVGGRRSFYRLADPFLGMWYACVRPHVSGLNMAARAARDHALAAWRHHVASVWEDICREQWHYLHLDGTTWEPAGRYWEGRAAGASEWDVVSVSVDRSRVFVGECKWQRHATRARVVQWCHEIMQRPVPAAASAMHVQRGLFLPEVPPGIRGLPVVLLDAHTVLAARASA